MTNTSISKNISDLNALIKDSESLLKKESVNHVEKTDFKKNVQQFLLK